MFRKIALVVFSLYVTSFAAAGTQSQLRLDFAVQPQSSCNGELGTITVRVYDSTGSIGQLNSPITLSVVNRGGSLQGTRTVAAINGTATFTDLHLDEDLTGVRLQAFARAASPAYSNSFNVGQSACKDHFEGLRHVTVLSTDRVRLKWDASTDPLVDKYRIYDVTNRNSPVLMQELGATSTQVTISALPSGRTYYFRLRSVDTSGIEDTNLTDVGVRLCDSAHTIPCDDY